MNQLKRALLKAGFASTEQMVVKERQPKKKVPLSEEQKGHEIRVQCEVCMNFTNDIERYDHRDRRIDKQWLCVKCADEHQITDECRSTHQSPNARSGSFRRQYGRTKHF